jgi:hypothetical protein
LAQPLAEKGAGGDKGDRGDRGDKVDKVDKVEIFTPMPNAQYPMPIPLWVGFFINVF